jgi:tetratricopeptide (TPR) repeat protein
LSLNSRAASLDEGQPAPGDTKETVLRLLKRATTDLPWPKLPAGAAEMFLTHFRALFYVARLGEPELAVEILNRHVEDIERRVVAPSDVARYCILRLEWLLSAAIKLQDDLLKSNAYVAEAKGLLGQATRNLRGLKQLEEWTNHVSDLRVTSFHCFPGCVANVKPMQLPHSCRDVLRNGVCVHLLLEIVAFSRELIKVAPAGLKPDCYLHSADAMMGLQQLDEAEEMLHEGLAVCRQEGVSKTNVSPTTSLLSPDFPPQRVRHNPKTDPSVLRSQFLHLLAHVAIERGELEVALDFAHKALETARHDNLTKPEAAQEDLSLFLRTEANILDSLGRLEEALALDDEWLALNPGELDENWGALVRSAMKHIAAGEDDEAEQILRSVVERPYDDWHELLSKKSYEDFLRPDTVLAELLERRGTEEALAEAGTLRAEIARQIARHEARRAAALEELRAEAAEAVRQ